MLPARLRPLRTRRYVVAGRAGMDLYPSPPGTKIENAQTFSAFLGGSSGNIAAGLSRLGSSVVMLTGVSDDAMGRFVLNQLRAYGIDVSHVQTIGQDKPNTLAFSETRLDPQTVLYRSEAADLMLSTESVAALDWSGIGGLIVTGTCLSGEPSASALGLAVTLARQNGVVSALDIDYRARAWASTRVAREAFWAAAPNFDIVVGNDDEYAILTEVQRPAMAQIVDIAKDLVSRGVALAVVKLGDKGCIALTEDATTFHGIFDVSVRKPTGAGDAFLAGMLHDLGQEDASVSRAIVRGSAGAAIVVSGVGCASAMPTSEEVSEFLMASPSSRPFDPAMLSSDRCDGFSR